jgi:predicted ribosomally synthesized peptide with nif11-like leader
MKTVEEFIQRLQEDPKFEQEAQAYENSDEFINFVKSEGYDFTLDQLLDKFRQEDKVTDQPLTPAAISAKGVEDFIQRLQEDPDFERQAQAFENDDAFMEFVKNEGYYFTLDQLTDKFNQGKGLLKPQALSPPTPLIVAETSKQQLGDGSELRQQACPSPHCAEAQKRPGPRPPKFEEVGGGRRRGVKWRNVDS